MNGRKAVIVGAGGHAVSVAETVTAVGYTLTGFTSDTGTLTTLLGVPVFDTIPAGHLESGGIIVLAIGDNATRERVWKQVAEGLTPDQVPAVVHPSASVSRFALIGHGTVVMQKAVVASAANIGIGCILNTGCVLEHECTLGDFASLAPAAATGGRVTIGQRAAISIGATIKHGLSIGSDTVIGAASYANTDFPAGVVAYGVPARVVRTRTPDDPYLS